MNRWLIINPFPPGHFPQPNKIGVSKNTILKGHLRKERVRPFKANPYNKILVYDSSILVYVYIYTIK